jgi:ectoine hydroxylase-related dioxygenase (phytanoyl-CoA dioxygenase family)
MTNMTEPTNSVGAIFAEDGYYLAPGIYPDDELRELDADFDRIVEELERSGEEINARWGGGIMDVLDGGASTVIHTHNVHRYSSRWLQALRQERFLDAAEKILGPDIILHHTKLFQKPPREGAPFPIHQDWWYFPTRNDTMIAAIIFLTDADERTGGLCLYPGSHRLGRLENSSGLHAAESLVAYPLTEAKVISANRGDVLFFSYFTLHGSLPNRSDHFRKTVLVQMHSGSDYVLENEEVDHVNERLVLRGWNHHMSRARARE